MTKISGTILFVIPVFLFFQGCVNDKSRKNYKWSVKVCDNLYAETFSTFGQGAFGGDRDGKWFTDSISFRIFLGAFDEADGRINVECKKDSVFVTQFPDNLDVNKDLRSPRTRLYLMEDLKKLHNLNDF